MATHYVEITREEFEAWLDTLSPMGSKGWSRIPERAGLYLIHFSSLVSVLASSSIGGRDTVMGLGKGAMTLRMVARKQYARVLNNSTLDQNRYNRTKNWRTTVAKGVKAFHDVYINGQDWYDHIASIDDRPGYRKLWQSTIEKIPGFEKNVFLKSQYDKIVRGDIVSVKVQNVILENVEKAEAAPARQDPQKLDVDPVLVQGLELINMAVNSSFSESLLRWVRAGKPLSPKQDIELRRLEDQFLQYLAAVGTNAKAEDKPFLRTIYKKFRDEVLMTPDEVRQFREIAMPGRQAHLVDIPLAVREVDIPVTRWVDIPLTA